MVENLNKGGLKVGLKLKMSHRLVPASQCEGLKLSFFLYLLFLEIFHNKLIDVGFGLLVT